MPTKSIAFFHIEIFNFPPGFTHLKHQKNSLTIKTHAASLLCNQNVQKKCNYCFYVYNHYIFLITIDTYPCTKSHYVQSCSRQKKNLLCQIIRIVSTNQHNYISLLIFERSLIHFINQNPYQICLFQTYHEDNFFRNNMITKYLISIYRIFENNCSIIILFLKEYLSFLLR